jgi:parallel beta-helix repeat protein
MKNITGNHCSCDGEKPTQKYGTEEIGEADENTITGNQCHDNLQGGIRVMGQGSQIAANGGKVEGKGAASRPRK